VAGCISGCDSARGGRGWAPLPAPAPQAGKFRNGILSLAGQTSTKIFDAFRKGLRDLGYVEG
jgi:hypothetical protein